MIKIMNEEFICNRHRRMREVPNLNFEFTRDRGFLHQYYHLRSTEFSRILFTESATLFDTGDQASEVLIVRNKLQIVGGARIILRPNSNAPRLPIELAGWEIAEFLPVKFLHRQGYAEISRLFLLEEYQHAENYTAMARAIIKRMKLRKLHYGCLVSSIGASQLYHKALASNGIKCQSFDQEGMPVHLDSCRVQNVLSLFGVSNKSYAETPYHHAVALRQTSQELEAIHA